MKRFLAILLLLGAAGFFPPATTQAAGCQFVLGFATLHDAIPDVVGSCQADQAFAANGDAQQPTTNGLLAWRKADNFTAFNDGFHTWVNGPFGIQGRLNTERFPWEGGAGGHTAPAASALRPANVGVALVAANLAAPWALDFAPDGRVFFTERPGRIRVIQNNAVLPDPWATINVTQQAGSEWGLLGLTLDPDFATNHFVYVYYTAPGGGPNRIVRMIDQNGHGVLDKVLVDGIPAGGNHNGGRLKFGPDGMLYAGTGESGDEGLAQDLSSLGGKILRLSKDGGVPADNPFPGSYIWSYGHRNVEGFAWHPQGGMYATEHGPSGAAPFCCNDEVNLIDPGINYGWPVEYGPQSDPRFRSPLLESGTHTTWAPTGAAFISNGPLANSMLFTGLQSQALHRVVFGADGKTVVFQEELLKGKYGRLRDVEPAPDGSFWVLTSNRDGRGSPKADDDRILRVALS
ncbi:MAG TPA: PQQ-dependent sugar dehydrogenase [Chloroflexota bacterium]|nr:PQQ-dependent sugar dehydrogenase [Chloroflexota bacterium]